MTPKPQKLPKNWGKIKVGNRLVDFETLKPQKRKKKKVKVFGGVIVLNKKQFKQLAKRLKESL